MRVEHSQAPAEQSDASLSDVFRQALAQPAHIAVKRIKYAFAFKRINADMSSVLQRAFNGSDYAPLGVNLVGRFVAGKVGFGSEDTYWRYNVLEDYIDGHAVLKEQRGDLYNLLKANYDANQQAYHGKDAEKIISYFAEYSNS